MSLKSRVRKLEGQMNIRSPEEDARAYLQLGIRFGVFNKNVITQEVVQRCITEGWTLSNALRRANGATRGLPSRKHSQTIVHL